MIPKLLAWIAFALAMLSAVPALVVVFARSAVGDAATSLMYGSLSLLGLSILVAVALLVLSAFRT